MKSPFIETASFIPEELVIDNKIDYGFMVIDESVGTRSTVGLGATCNIAWYPGYEFDDAIFQNGIKAVADERIHDELIKEEFKMDDPSKIVTGHGNLRQHTVFQRNKIISAICGQIGVFSNQPMIPYESLLYISASIRDYVAQALSEEVRLMSDELESFPGGMSPAQASNVAFRFPDFV